MARCHFRTIVRVDGNAVQNALLTLYQKGTSIPVTNAWSAETGGVFVTTLLTNNQGEGECWFDTPQSVDVRVSDNGVTAYYASNPSSTVTFIPFTETVEVNPAPIDSTSKVIANVWTVPQFFAAGTVGQYDISPAMTQAEIDAKTAAWRANGGTLKFLSGIHTFTAPVQLPTAVLSGQVFTEWIVDAEPGAYLTTATPGLVFFSDTIPATTAIASARTNRKLTFRNLVMVGSNDTAQCGIRTIGTYGLVIENCIARFVGTGFDQIFALMGRVVSCITSGCVNYGFRSRSAVGVIGDASHTSSASNHTTFHSCRDYATTGMTAQFDILGSNGNMLYDIITEGGNPVNAIRFDKAANTNCQLFGISNWHPENFPTNANLYLTGGACRVLVERVVWTVGDIMIDASSTSTSISVRDCPFLAGKFRHHASVATGSDWTFDGISSPGTDISAAALWDGVVPTYRYVRRFSGGGDGAGGNYPLIEGSAIYLKTGSLVQVSPATSPGPSAYFAAASIFACWGAATNPAFLRNGDWYAYRDEAANKLMFVVKYSDGTVKTGNVALT